MNFCAGRVFKHGGGPRVPIFLGESSYEGETMS